MTDIDELYDEPNVAVGSEIAAYQSVPAVLLGLGDLGVAVSGEIGYAGGAVGVKIYGRGLAGGRADAGEIFAGNRRFISEDFPTLERPETAISGRSDAGS